MSATPAEGVFSKLGFGDTSTVDQPFEFVSCGIRMQQTHGQSNGVRGTRARKSHRVRVTRQTYSGPIVMNPSVAEIDYILPRALGGTTSLGVTGVAENLTEFFIQNDQVSDVKLWTGCKVSRMTLAGASGQPLTLTLDIEARTETVSAAGTFPAITIDTGNMFIMSHCAITLAASARPVASFSLVLDNVLDTGRFLNALERSHIPEQDRLVTLDCQVPYSTDNTALYNQSVAGAAGSLVITDGTTTYTIDFGNLKAPAEGPQVGGRTEIMLPLSMQSYATASLPEIKFTKT